MKEVEVKVDLNLRRLLNQEDLDQDLRITIEDRGPKLFLLEDLKGKHYEIAGSYPLSNLLQLLAYAHQERKKVIKLKFDEIFLNPVDHLSKAIKERYWDALTRTLDEKGIVELLEDPKTNLEQSKRIYVSFKDPQTVEYFEKVGLKHPYLHLEVKILPENLQVQDYLKLEQSPGLLALKIDHATQKGRPFLVPGGRFNELYAWDSYFIVLGLLQDGRRDLALSIVENFVYEIEHYHAILNGNRSYYLSRSQPPLFTSMISEVLNVLPKKEHAQWLQIPLNAVIKEYFEVWCSPNRITETGLARYFGFELKEPPEVERGHFNPVYMREAKKEQVSFDEFRNGYRTGKIKSKVLDLYFVHDRAMRESGHDTTNRLVNLCAHYNTVDLNSLLYKYEIDIAGWIALYYEGAYTDSCGRKYSAKEWLDRASERKEKMMELMWDPKRALFFDYNFHKKERSTFESVTTFYPLFAGIISQQEAKELIENGLSLFESPGGLVSTTRASRGRVSEDRPQRQWDYPFGWAPHQILFWKGALNYGFQKEVTRLAYRWLYLITKQAADYNGLIAEKYDVLERTHKMNAEYGNEGTDFGLYPDGGFGWVNASYQIGLTYLSAKEMEHLKALHPPECLFENKEAEAD